MLVTDDGEEGHQPEELEQAADNLEGVLDDDPPEAEDAPPEDEEEQPEDEPQSEEPQESAKCLFLESCSVDDPIFYRRRITPSQQRMISRQRMIKVTMESDNETFILYEVA